MLCALCFSFCFIEKGYAQVVPLTQAHAHNDYHHPRPLYDALAQGFTSIEADVLLIDGELYVGHDMPTGTHQLPTLKAAYLNPLAAIAKANGGKIYLDYEPPVYLMIDIKTDAEETYKVLKVQLDEFREILRIEKDGKLTGGAIRVFLSGNRPVQTVFNEKEKLVGIDGRPADLEKQYSSGFMPVISENYFKVLQWDGSGKIPSKALKKLTKLANKVHRQHKKLRLWAAPDNQNTWRALLDARVDLINTDKLEEFCNFMESYKGQ